MSYVPPGRPHPRPRPTPDGRLLATRDLIAVTCDRNLDWIRKRIPPVACDVGTRRLLYDATSIDARPRLVDRPSPVAHSERAMLDECA